MTHTAEPSNQAWWQVDLGTNACVDQVQVWDRTDCCADRLTDFWVLTSAHPITADGLDAAAPPPASRRSTSRPGRAARPR
ncbi:hypothetical protein ACF08N_13855 [Streptomyces sp. NPDC015127]|uniref:galactose-binding domain-containing protein n=1 Tax=Streptomyces sp. NPDC015127 TaxID=3364939 RepID=UPI0036F90BBA